MSPNTLLAVGLTGIFSAFAVALVVLVFPDTSRRQVSRSLQAIAAAGSGSGQLQQPPAQSFVDRVLVPSLGLFARLARRFSPSGVNARLARRLDLAGNPPGSSVERTLSYKGAGFLFLGLLGCVFGRHSIVWLILLGGTFAAAGFFLPDILLYNSGLKRQQRIQKGLPDALDLLTISVEAGLGFDAALGQVARNTYGPISAEFFRVLQEMQIGKSRADAFRSLNARTDVPELRAFVGSLVQADSLGIPIGNVLREQAKEMRLKRQQRAEERAQKIPVKVLFPLIFFIMPSLFIVIIGPGAISIYHAFIGH